MVGFRNDSIFGHSLIVVAGSTQHHETAVMIARGRLVLVADLGIVGRLSLQIQNDYPGVVLMSQFDTLASPRGLQGGYTTQL